MLNKNIKIYVIMHKIVDLKWLKIDSIYERLMVGKEECEDKMIKLDSIGDNISYKNNEYCELTGLYWMWKNSKEDYIGLCHYRRFFSLRNKILDKEDVLQLLSKYNIILAPKWYTTENVYERYKKDHIIQDLDLCRDIIKKNYNEYLESFDIVMKSHSIHTLNMFIAKKSVIDDYCEWLFGIFYEIEKNINLKERDQYQQRVYGFLSERLFNVWIEYNKLKKYECDVYNTEKKTLDILKSAIKKIVVKTRLVLNNEI